MALAAIFQLTNTFSRESTTSNDFVADRDVESPLPTCDPFGIIRLAHEILVAGREQGAIIIPALQVFARSAGPIKLDAVNDLSDRLANGLDEAGPNIDALILMLSGAMTNADYQSADLQFIRLARNHLGAEVPIIALFSRHANLNKEIVDAVDVCLDFDSTDDLAIQNAARKTVRIAAAHVSDGFKPTASVRKLRLLVPIAMQTESREPFASVCGLARDIEQQPGVISVGLFPGFPYADMIQSGCSVVVTTDNDLERAGLLAQRLQMSIWDRREEFALLPQNVEIAVHNAMLSQSGPVVIADMGDDPEAGAAGDGTGLLWALIDLGALDAALGVMVDKAGVEQAVDCGVGNEISLDIGGNKDRRAGYPVNVSAKVRKISDGRLLLDDTCKVDLGRVAVLDVKGRHGGQIDVIVAERAPESITPGLFTALGIDITGKKIVGVKSARAGQTSFASIAARVLVTSTPGITTPMLTYFDFERIPRPIYPLDPM